MNCKNEFMFLFIRTWYLLEAAELDGQIDRQTMEWPNLSIK